MIWINHLKENKVIYYMFGESFFILVGIVPPAILLSTWIVALFIWSPAIKKYEKQEMDPVLYENLYPFHHDEIIMDNSGQSLSNMMIFENTPQGYILFRFNKEENTFEYWSNGAILDKYLDAAARKYVQVFRCECFYISPYEELTKKWKEKKAAKKAEEKAEEEKTGVFAVFKKQTKKNVLVVEKANKYINRGRLSECDYFKVEKKKEKKFCFVDFKKMTQSAVR